MNLYRTFIKTSPVVIPLFDFECLGGIPERNNTEWDKIDMDEYSIEYPRQWEADTTVQEGFEFFIFITDTYPDVDFRDNINLLIEPLNPGVDLDQYVEKSKYQGENYLSELKDLESRTIVSDCQLFHELIYAAEIDSIRFKWKQHFWVHDQKAFVLTYSALDETFDESLITVNDVFESFRIK